MKKPGKMDAPAVAGALNRWFIKNGRDYPWRRTADPYAILISEVMLQQTQISTVLDRGYYARWLETFPDFKTLAAAPENKLLKTWEGLGYYRRARNLQLLAQTVVDRHDGVFPADPIAIRALPGIGPYTAGAISSFAFGLPEPLVDGNVARVLSRLHDDATPIDSKEGSKRLWDRAADLVRLTDDPRIFNSAVMELGQRVCKPTKPLCGECPVQAFCEAKEPESLPVKKDRAKLTEVTERVMFVQNSAGVLLECETGSRRTGLWKLPVLPEEHAAKPPPVLLKTRYGITRYKVTLWVHESPVDALAWPDTHRFIAREELEYTAMPSPYRKALNQLLEAGTGEFRLQG